jgi:hypothetical protein
MPRLYRFVPHPLVSLCALASSWGFWAERQARFLWLVTFARFVRCENFA